MRSSSQSRAMVGGAVVIVALSVAAVSIRDPQAVGSDRFVRIAVALVLITAGVFPFAMGAFEAARMDVRLPRSTIAAAIGSVMGAWGLLQPDVPHSLIVMLVGQAVFIIGLVGLLRAKRPMAPPRIG